MPFEVGNLKEVALKALVDKAVSKAITFVEARTNDGQVMLGVNDLFIGPKSHTSARYNIHWNGQADCLKTQSPSRWRPTDMALKPTTLICGDVAVILLAPQCVCDPTVLHVKKTETSCHRIERCGWPSVATCIGRALRS